MKLKVAGCIFALLFPACVGFAQSTAFQDGQRARADWETWFGALTNDLHDGAYYWSGQRSLPKPGSCYSPDGKARRDWTVGCLAAQLRLAPTDVRRRTEPDFKLGWNSTASDMAPSPPALVSLAKPAGESTSPKEPQSDTFMTWQGAGEQTTRPFHVGTPWELSWRSERSFSVFVQNADDDALVTTASGNNSGSSYVRRGGTFYLTIFASGPWSMAGRLVTPTPPLSAERNSLASRDDSLLSGLKIMNVHDLPILQAQADANIDRFMDDVSGKAVFVAQGRFVGFEQQPVPVPTWSASIVPDGGNGRWVSCFYDHSDAKLSDIRKDTRVNIVGFVGIPVKNGLILGGNCLINIQQ